LFRSLSKRILENRAANAFRRHLQVLRSGYNRPNAVTLPAVQTGEMQAEDFLPESVP
jgi:hypothetical protein